MDVIGVLKQVKVTVPRPCRVTVTVRSQAGNQLGQNSGGPSGGATTVVSVPDGAGNGIALEDGDTVTATIDCPCFQHDVRDYVFRDGRFVEIL
jgi:hypothetical protein